MEFAWITCIVSLLSTHSVGFKRGFRLKIHSNTSGLDGLACAVDRYDFARGVKFDPVTKTCTELTVTWFTSPTYDGRSIYFTVKVVKKYTEQSNFTEMNFLPDFALGGSVILYLKTGNVDEMNGYRISFKNQDATITGFFMLLVGSGNIVIYNSHIAAKWGTAKVNPDPFTTPNKVYKLEFDITTTQVKTYIDGSHFYSFTHRTSVDNYQVVTFMGQVCTVDEIHFTYPAPA